MKRKFSLGATCMLVLIAVILTFQLTVIFEEIKYTKQLSGNTRYPSDEPKITEIKSIINEKYLNEVDSKRTSDLAAWGFVLGLDDPYAAYYTKEQYEELINDHKGNMVGLGIRVFLSSDEKMIIYDVMKNSPAENAGLQKGDVITGVSGKTFEELGYTDTYNALVGKAGESVDIEIFRHNTTFNVSVVRENFEEETVDYSVSQTDSSIGYIKIYSFDTATPEQFKNAVNELVYKSGVKSIIFDVRDNPGGTLQSVHSILDFLLPEGDVVKLVDKEGKSQTLTSDKNELSVPMVVIANGESASAAELFVAALQDHSKATFIGTKTYGKGTAQEFFRLDDGSAIKITVNSYLPPFSPSYDGIGITPDIVVEQSDDVDNPYLLSESEDKQLIAAINYLQ